MGEYDGVAVGFLIGLLVGIPVGWLIAQPMPRASSPPPASKAAVKAVENIESWDVWEDEGGHMHATIHRKVKPSEE